MGWSEFGPCTCGAEAGKPCIHGRHGTPMKNVHADRPRRRERVSVSAAAKTAPKPPVDAPEEPTPEAPPKAMTIRLAPDQADELETLASVENRPVSEVIRTAIAQYVDTVKQDDGFQAKLREHIERTRKLLVV